MEKSCRDGSFFLGLCGFLKGAIADTRYSANFSHPHFFDGRPLSGMEAPIEHSSRIGKLDRWFTTNRKVHRVCDIALLVGRMV